MLLPQVWVKMNKKLLGSFYLFLSAGLYGLVGVFSRFISKFGSFSQSWVKSLILLFIIGTVIFFKKKRWRKIQRQDLKWFAVWILPASCQPVLTFLAFNHLPIGLVYFLTYVTMILGGILSGSLFFGEKMTRVKLMSLGILILGLFLLYHSGFNLTGNIWVLVALLSGLIVGFWNTLTKKVSAKYSAFQMMFLDNSVSLALCLTGSLFLKERLPDLVMDSRSWLWIVIFGFSLTLAGFFLINGFKNTEAQVGSLILPLEIVFGTFFGFLFFGEVLTTIAYFGGFLILTAALLPSLNYKNKRNFGND